MQHRFPRATRRITKPDRDVARHDQKKSLLVLMKPDERPDTAVLVPFLVDPRYPSLDLSSWKRTSCKSTPCGSSRVGLQVGTDLTRAVTCGCNVGICHVPSHRCSSRPAARTPLERRDGNGYEL